MVFVFINLRRSIRYFSVIRRPPIGVEGRLDRGIQYHQFFLKKPDYPVEPDNDNHWDRFSHE